MGKVEMKRVWKNENIVGVSDEGDGCRGAREALYTNLRERARVDVFAGHGARGRYVSRLHHAS